MIAFAGLCILIACTGLLLSLPLVTSTTTDKWNYEAEYCNDMYKITSHPHMNAFGELCGKPKKGKRKTKFTADDLMSFKQLGYAVCNNKLDKYGKKVYIHHNKRTFKEKKEGRIL